MAIDPYITDALDEDSMPIGELWEALTTFCKNRAEDNLRYGGKYPLALRQLQLVSLKALVEEIELFHDHFEELKGDLYDHVN